MVYEWNEKSTAPASKDEIDKASALLNSQKDKVQDRFRALFLLRNVDLEGPAGDIVRAAHAIGDCLLNKTTSALLKHECAYCLGQIGAHPAARSVVVPLLYKALCDLDQPAIARHESGEALGAIGAHEYLAELEKIAETTSPDWPIEVKQTCELAAARIRYVQSNPALKDKIVTSPFDSVDPSPAEETPKNMTVEDVKALGAKLINTKSKLFDRYKVIFALRNFAGDTTNEAIADEAVRQLIHGFDHTTPDEALLRHEVAFALGQLGSRAEKFGVTSLLKRLQDSKEHPMVRHEAAEALGAIASEASTDALKKYSVDPEPVVFESCVVALDLAEYERSDSFEFCTLQH